MTSKDGIISAAEALGMAQAAQDKAIKDQVPKILKGIMNAISAKASQGLTAIRYEFDVSDAPLGLDMGLLAKTILNNLIEHGYRARLVGANMIFVSWEPPREPPPS